MKSLVKYIVKEFTKKEIYLIFFASFTMALMFAWRMELKNKMFWRI